MLRCLAWSFRFGCSLVILAVCLASSACFAPAAAAGQSYTLEDGARARTYKLYRPANLTPDTPVPLVIVLHGGFGSGGQAEDAYNWDDLADRKGFVVVYPDGVDHSWNAGGTCCGPAMRGKVDDVGFLTHLIEAVSAAQNIDPRRVYLTGMSNGAAMSYRYGCEGTYPLAAIGAVAGAFSYDCPLPHAVSVLAIHGMLDQNVPFAGGRGAKGKAKVDWWPVEKTLESFRKVDVCAPASEERSGVVRTQRAFCRQGRAVTLVTVEDAGHQWPGSKLKKNLVYHLLQLDKPSTAFDATALLWDFFQTQTSGGLPEE